MTTFAARGVQVRYGETRVLHGVDFEVQAGEIVCLLGRNGAGKTTLLRGLMGLVPLHQGTVHLDGDPIANRSPHAIARRKVGYVPQEKGVFASLSVRENLRVGNGSLRRNGLNSEWLAPFPVLTERLDQKAGTLSGGEQKMLALARALLREPAMLLLDEPTEGVQPSIIERIGETLRRMNAQTDVSILLVEQHLEFALGLAGRFLVLEKGRIVERGQVSELDDVGRIRKHLVV